MQIRVDEQKCTGCNVCVRVCPQMILEVVEKTMRVRDDGEARCMGCFGCEDECPASAVRVLRAPQSVSDIQIEPPLNVDSCDVAIVGAGPSGVGAAITCAKAGLDVVVFERLPNRTLSHHTDGGVLFTFPEMTSIQVDEQHVAFPGLDISINARIAKKCGFLGLLGPDELSTDNRFPASLECWAGDKDTFMEALINEAEAQGAKFWFNAKVEDVLKDGDAVAGVKLNGGQEIRAKVVVTADGVLARVSEKAGMRINKDDLWYASVLAFEYDNAANLPGGLYYLNGDMQFDDDMPVAFGGLGITEVIHVLIAFLSRKKWHAAPKPMDYYVGRLLERDARVHRIVGDALNNAQPKMLTGCRGVFRAESNTHPVGNGVISVGDAWVDDGEIGNVGALANGVFAGRVIVEAAQRHDFSEAALLRAKDFVSPKLVRALAENKKMKLLSTRFNDDDMRHMFLMMQHMNYPVLLLGSKMQQAGMFTKFFAKNLINFVKYPNIVKAFL